MYYMITRDQPRCVYCEMAKNLANKAGLDYKTFSRDQAEIAEFMDLNGLRSFPAIFKDKLDMEHYIGGHTEFQKHIYSN